MYNVRLLELGSLRSQDRRGSYHRFGSALWARAVAFAKLCTHLRPAGSQAPNSQFVERGSVKYELRIPKDEFGFTIYDVQCTIFELGSLRSQDRRGSYNRFGSAL